MNHSRGRSSNPRSSRESSLEEELPEFMDSSTLESETVLISPDFNNLRLVAPQVCLAGVENASEGALPLHFEGIVEGGIKVFLTRERCGLRSWSMRESERESRLRDEQLLQVHPRYTVEKRQNSTLAGEGYQGIGSRAVFGKEHHCFP